MMMHAASGGIVIAFALFLIGLGLISFVRRQHAKRFLEAFASSARAHYIEQTLRLIAGTAIIVFSPSMWHSPYFRVFGWLIVVSSLVLFLLPWRWHHSFGQWAIPLAIQHQKLHAVGALLVGALLLYGASRAALRWL